MRNLHDIEEPTPRFRLSDLLRDYPLPNYFERDWIRVPEPRRDVRAWYDAVYEATRTDPTFEVREVPRALHARLQHDIDRLRMAGFRTGEFGLRVSPQELHLLRVGRAFPEAGLRDHYLGWPLVVVL